MDFGRKFILNFSELHEFEFPINERIELIVNHNDVKYEFLVRIAQNNKNLICFGTGATDRDKFPPPYYSRHSWYPQFEESVIIYNDPTLYLDDELRLGWGVGKNEEWYLQVIADIIRIILTKNDILPENTIFFGTSGAGFMSIILATLLKKSTAMVNNPQTNIQKWYIFDRMISACFDNLDLDSILESYGHRFDVIKTFEKENYVPPITYMVNIGEQKDIINHLLPFIEGLLLFETLTGKINIVLYYGDKGHNDILSPENTIKLINDHFNQKNKIEHNSPKIYENVRTVTGHIGEITKNRTIQQQIEIPNNLKDNEKTQIEILMATFARENSNIIEISLKQDHIIEKVQISSLEIKDNQYKKIIFNSSSFKKGKALLTIKGIDSSEGNAVTVYLTKDTRCAGAIVDGKQINESLIFKAYVT